MTEGNSSTYTMSFDHKCNLNVKFIHIYNMKVSLCACMSLGSIYLCDIILYHFLGTSYMYLAKKKNSGFCWSTMASSHFDPYHGLWPGGTPSKHIDVTTTSVEMICALGLGIIASQPVKYYHYSTELFCDFFSSMVLCNYMTITY